MRHFSIIALMLPVILGGCFIMTAEKPVTVTMEGTAVWMDTGVSVNSSDSVEIKASGGISLNTTMFPNFDVDPEGMPEFGTPQSIDPDQASLYPIPGAVIGILVGKVGTNGTPFVIGKSDTFTPDESGRIYVMANDYPATNNGGSWSIVITVSSPLL